VAHAHSHAPGGSGSAHLHTDEGLRTAVIATLGLLLTGAIELGIFFLFARSAGLLADAFHNLGDVSTTIAIGIAFSVSRRDASERYPYGLHRAEDLAGVFVLLVMAASAVVAGWESTRALMRGETPDNLGVGMAAALIGVAGNELVAQYKIRVGKRIRSLSLQADGQHSRQDGLVSLAAFIGLLGASFGLEWADGVAGLVITAVIVIVLVTTARDVIGRALDAVEPALVRKIATVSAGVEGVTGVHDVRARWAGRRLWAALNLELPPEMPLIEAHAISERVHHTLLHEIEGLTLVDIHMDPGEDHEGHHRETAHHFGQDDDDHDDHDHDNGHDHDDHITEDHAHEHTDQHRH
jgi:cation diffusion facilitator family transporter